MIVIICFVEKSGNTLKFASGTSKYQQLVSDTGKDYATWASECSGKLTIVVLIKKL